MSMHLYSGSANPRGTLTDGGVRYEKYCLVQPTYESVRRRDTSLKATIKTRARHISMLLKTMAFAWRLANDRQEVGGYQSRESKGWSWDEVEMNVELDEALIAARPVIGQEKSSMHAWMMSHIEH
jgi:hypothetical protein